MIVRPARGADAAGIAAIWNRMIRDTQATFTTTEKTQEDVEGLIAHRPGAFWVAQDSALAGFVTFGPFRSGPGYAATAEHTVILADRAQGQGAGRQLMRRALQAAAAQGCHVMVAAISSANPPAVAFHTALGFTQTGRLPEVGHKAGQWLDLILMQKTLTAP